MVQFCVPYQASSVAGEFQRRRWLKADAQHLLSKFGDHFLTLGAFHGTLVLMFPYIKYTAIHCCLSCDIVPILGCWSADQQFNEICVEYCGISVSVHCPGAITYTYLHPRIWSHHIMVSHVLMGGFHMGHMGWWWMLANGFRLPLDPSLCTKVERSCMEWALDQSPGSSEGCCKSPWCSKEVDAKTIPNQLLGIHFTGSWDWWVICFILPGRRTAFIALCRALISRDLHNAWIPTQLNASKIFSISCGERQGQHSQLHLFLQCYLTLSCRCTSQTGVKLCRWRARAQRQHRAEPQVEFQG